MLFSVDTNEAECPYCPPGMQCDPTTNTCVKGSYARQRCAWSHLISISVSYSRRQTCTYVCTVHISRTYSANYTYDSCLHTRHKIFNTITTVAHDHEEIFLADVYVFLKRYLFEYTHPSCSGERFSPETLAVYILFALLRNNAAIGNRKSHMLRNEKFFLPQVSYSCTLHFLGLHGLSHSFSSGLH